MRTSIVVLSDCNNYLMYHAELMNDAQTPLLKNLVDRILRLSKKSGCDISYISLL